MTLNYHYLAFFQYFTHKLQMTAILLRKMAAALLAAILHIGEPLQVAVLNAKPYLSATPGRFWNN